MDRVNIIHNLQNLKVQFDDNAPFVVLKYKLQLEILENMKINEENVYYTRLKQETKNYLEFHRTRLEKKQYQCCFVGCIFKCRKHLFYIRHIQSKHARDTNFLCQYGMVCTRTFSSLDLLLEHVNQVHTASDPPNSNLARAPINIEC